MLRTGGITSAKGFKAWGEHVGLKKYKKDLALIVSEAPATVAAVFTTNLAKAAPILWNQKILSVGNKVSALLINSGQANSCTGAQGILNAGLMAERTAAELGCQPGAVMLASTGLIGVQIKMEQALAGIKVVAENVRHDEFAGMAAAEAILTTDSGTKQCAATIEISGVEVTLGAMAKGSGMIHPNMATTLGFIATDVAIAPHLLQQALKKTIDTTFNMISVDGDTSTNDMVVVLANGLAGNPEITEEGEAFDLFCVALEQIAGYLSKKIACDVEGATKRVAVTVTGAATVADARVLARKVVSSNLVKASMHKFDANWGRVIAAVGSAGVEVDIYGTTIGFRSEKGAMIAFADGEQHTDYCETHGQQILNAGEVEIWIALQQGSGIATAWGCDMEQDTIRTSKKSLTKILAEVG
jgi:glutamate N-acetyltransferase/amino-acid N-acetyltransferase